MKGGPKSSLRPFLHRALQIERGTVKTRLYFIDLQCTYRGLLSKGNYIRR